MKNTFDAIVLGAGALGSAAAYHLAKTGQKVLLLEQFELDHQKGSSYGHSRITRYAYDNPVYVNLMKSVYPAWATFEQEAGEKLYTRTGGIDFGRSAQTSLQAVMDSMTEAEIPYEALSPTEAQKRFPQFRFDDDMLIVYQADTGILPASRCVRAHLRLGEQYGATIKPDTTVKSVQVKSDTVEVITETERFSAGTLVITAGSWSASILSQLGLNLPLKPMRCQEIYFDTANQSAYETNHFPAFIGHIKDQYGYQPYGIASHNGSGLKVSLHGGQLVNHPSEIDYTPDANIIEKVIEFCHRYLPEVTNLRSARVCLYTMTPDEHFIIDSHPEYPHIVFGGGCSGHAFKFSNLIGKILTQLLLEGKTEYDISLFTAHRFLQ